ncbi:2,3-dehydroadipyl-CoA hydratase [Zhongshania aliphaticivorans]|uniref:2,3-dehydroadipyl-CoA hydratase n=1 Tax=Zhongshania aliphaticivorans TaxID=1470434 RepID=A0A5S9Q465_9GAMM|nr:enoyl-CoA hydratase-related protein [Zhongshania aliphaticivorans]CAA0093739.1 2,3-dehydroadipyl-CoA hydratase [Zhongshania aliphaticivorans]CAA0111757.1 2,3-dehydroadipyl-CoA hydratase [Zhongshania aliphaticivorans]
MSDTVIQQLDSDGVLLITLNRPNKKNAFNIEQWLAFRDALLAAEDNPQVACVVITGAGDDFSSGVDLNDFSETEGEHPFTISAKTLVDFNKPVISAAKGVAVGGGATLLLHTDVVYVGASLRLRFPFTALGLVPEWGSSYQLQAIIGARKAAELMYTSEWLNAERSVELGIATAACTDEELLEKAMAKAKEIAQWPISSLVETKKLMRNVHRAAIHSAMGGELEGMSRLAGSPENIEAVVALMEKRQPDFKQFRK